MLCVLVEGRKDKWWVRAFCFNVKAGDHYHIFLYVLCACFCATGTLPAEALLRRVQTQGATIAFVYACVLVFFWATSTLPAESLLWKCKKQGATIAFFAGFSRLTKR